MKTAPIYILIILLIAVLVFKCDNKPSSTSNQYVPYDVLIEVHDTIISIDTFNHYRIIVDLDTVINDYKYKLSEYHYKIQDSVLDGTIVATSPFKPDIDFTYKLKTYTIKDSTVLRENNYRGLLYGGRIAVSPLLTQMSVTGAYQFKRGDIIDLSLGRDFQNNYNIITVGYMKRF